MGALVAFKIINNHLSHFFNSGDILQVPNRLAGQSPLPMIQPPTHRHSNRLGPRRTHSRTTEPLLLRSHLMHLICRLGLDIMRAEYQSTESNEVSQAITHLQRLIPPIPRNLHLLPTNPPTSSTENAPFLLRIRILPPGHGEKHRRNARSTRTRNCFAPAQKQA